MAGNGNGWTKYEMLVLEKLESHSKWLLTLNQDSQQMKIDLTKMKIYWGLLSVLGGGFVAVVMRLIAP